MECICQSDNFQHIVCKSVIIWYYFVVVGSVRACLIKSRDSDVHLLESGHQPYEPGPLDDPQTINVTPVFVRYALVGFEFRSLRLPCLSLHWHT